MLNYSVECDYTRYLSVFYENGWPELPRKARRDTQIHVPLSKPTYEAFKEKCKSKKVPMAFVIRTWIEREIAAK